MTKQRFILCMLVLLLLCCPSVTFAGESAVYTVTEQELCQLEQNLDQLSKQRSLLLQELEKLNEQQTRLDKQLATLKALSQTQEMQLKTANESLKAYEQEVRRKTRRIKAQRTFAYSLALGLAYTLITK